jgi:pimeloyl-ACP methyl ester carboxylesterase
VPTMIVSDTYVAYDVHGVGEPVLLIAPAGTRAAIWLTHLVPALQRGGYQVITFDNRGTAPSAVPPGPYRLADLVADTADLIGGLELAPCRIVGSSLGAMVAQELAAAQPGLVRAAVLLGTRCRTDFFRREMTRATAARILDPDPALTTDFDVLVAMAQMFSARTLADDKAAADWFSVLRRFPVRGPGAAAQYEATLTEDRATALASVRCPCLVVGFTEDVITPPALCREVAGAIPAARYAEIGGCGHFGYLEEPATVSGLITDFFASV